MLSWIPILGPIIDGIVKIAGGFFSTKQAQIQADVETSKTIAHTTEVFKDDIGIRLSRDIILFPVSVWTALTTWDIIVVHHWPDLVWTTGAYQPGSGLTFLPYAVMSFLFGLNLMNIWKRYG